MTKTGDISENTPPEQPKPNGGCCGGRCKTKPVTKQAADAVADHPTTRTSDAVADAMRARK